MCNRLGIDAEDRLKTGTRKRKFLVKGVPPQEVSKIYYFSYFWLFIVYMSIVYMEKRSLTNVYTSRVFDCFVPWFNVYKL